ncbi:phosphohydrolase [Defluviimonas sp. 20V17]|uniref:Hydrolase n=1 Tax=Allgaiera indica TaxID=765699 RepID=A0AAN4ZXY9_9RHOB|nr:HD domain-containing protein [Allgaiera indica]KDB02492.1 phosphohydrolase [Defluviimonas sp. 20V17]GHD98763.1 hydrolase [Allgaiera indica]SDW06696.1 uncharacterized protein SAMN05444006_101191 [Allgaiera indica]
MSFDKDLTRALAGAKVDTAHDLGHIRRVWANARAIAAGEGIAVSRALQGAVWLHDLVAPPKDDPGRALASRRSAEAARPVLARLGLSDEEIATACHAIAAHSFSAGIAPQTQEARILQDADRLDALGAVGLARVFAVAGTLGRPLYDPADPFATDRGLDDGRWALDHFAVKLLRLPAAMQTATGRRIGARRAQVLRGYLATLAEEIGTAPPGW